MKKTAQTSTSKSTKHTHKEKKHKQTDSSSFRQSSFFAFPYTDSQNETLYIQNELQADDNFIHSPIYTFQKTHKPLTWCYSITPVHLRNMDIICKIFGRSRYTVKQWAKEGAPIVYDGVSYISEYNALFSWLLNYYKDTILQ